MSEKELQWLEIRDWTPGIRQRSQNDPAYRTAGVTSPVYGLVSQAHGVGAVDGTFRCIALPDGGIGPLPREGTGLARTGNPLPANTTAFVTGFGILGPTVAPFSGPGPTFARPVYQDINARNNSLIVGYHYDSGSDRVVNLERWFQLNGGALTFDTIFTQTETGTAGNPPGAVWTAFGRSSLSGGGTNVGPPMVAASYTGYGGTPFGFTLGFPDPHNPTSTTPVGGSLVGNSNPSGMVVAHQSRFVFMTETVWAQGRSALWSQTNEDIVYTVPNDFFYGGFGPASGFASNFSPEDPVGIGVAASLSSSDLLLIKHQYGAYLIQGDLDAPMVRRLPGVMPTMGATQKGALTPIGFVYGSNGGGVYVWNGGDGSTNISQQLDPSFWQLQLQAHENISTTGVRRFQGQFAAWGEWVLAPNNWVYDTNTNSWWRLQDPAVHQFWMYQPDILTPTLYACGPTFSNTNNLFVLDYDKTLGATNWTWQSQPIVIGNYRRIDIKDMVVVFQSQSSTGGTLTVTLSDDTGTTYTKVITYAHNGGRVQVARFTVAPVYSNDAYFRVSLNADGGANTAPIVNLIRFGYEDVKEIARV